MRARVCACASLYIITTLSTKSIGKRCSKIVVAICESLVHLCHNGNANERQSKMSYGFGWNSCYTGVTVSGDKFIAKFWGDSLGTFDTWAEANAAVIERRRR